MTQRPVSTMAIVFGILAVIGVLLPWHSQVIDVKNGGADLISCQRGFEDEPYPFLGLYTLILAGAGTALLVWFATKRTTPGLSRILLSGAILVFAVGIGLTIRDLRLDLPTSSVTVGDRTIAEGRAFGILLTIVGCSVAFVMSGIAFLSPKTPYKD